MTDSVTKEAKRTDTSETKDTTHQTQHHDPATGANIWVLTIPEDWDDIPETPCDFCDCRRGLCGGPPCDPPHPTEYL
jgi:hypothetical protein